MYTKLLQEKMLYFQSFLTAYCLWKSCQIRIREPNLNPEILMNSTYGTYFSCPSLEISSTSLSSRLSIAMFTASPDAILKKYRLQLFHMSSHVSADFDSRALAIQVHATTYWNNSCVSRWASNIFRAGGKTFRHIFDYTCLFKACNVFYDPILKIESLIIP